MLERGNVKKGYMSLVNESKSEHDDSPVSATCNVLWPVESVDEHAGLGGASVARYMMHYGVWGSIWTG